MSQFANLLAQSRASRGIATPEPIVLLPRLYYYRPIAGLPGVYKCAGYGAEDPAHREFYTAEFTKNGRPAAGIEAGAPIISEYIADRITADLKPFKS